MAKNFSGKQWQCVVGLRDQSATAIGSGAGTFVSNSNVFMELETLNGISFDAGLQTSEAVKSGKRILNDEDMVQHYGSGTWTWDFDYLVKNEVALQNLLGLIYNGGDVTTAFTIPVAPVFEDLSHGAGGAVDRTADVLLLAPEDLPSGTDSGIRNADHRLHSAVLQNLTLSMDMGTDAGRLRASGQFMSGYSPLINDSGATGVSTPSNFEKSLFDCDTRTVGSFTTVTTKAFSITISNPATRVGFQGASGNCDGYVRGGAIDITGSINVKYDGDTEDLLEANYLGGAGNTLRILVEEGSGFSFDIPAARLTGFNKDYAEDGMFVELPFKATAGADAGASGGALIIKAT
tara:strand:+ start:59 stop:1102 length:1044 start_codon:yes stop_codon:yes gene_type:complete